MWTNWCGLALTLVCHHLISILNIRCEEIPRQCDTTYARQWKEKKKRICKAQSKHQFYNFLIPILSSFNSFLVHVLRPMPLCAGLKVSSNERDHPKCTKLEMNLLKWCLVRLSLHDIFRCKWNCRREKRKRRKEALIVFDVMHIDSISIFDK